MNVGMLWLDADQKRPFDEKVKRAAHYYQEKYGRSPTLCLVNEQMLEKETQVDQILVTPVHTVLPNHFWIGVDVQQQTPA